MTLRLPIRGRYGWQQGAGLLLAALLLPAGLRAQTSYTLTECIQRVQEENLQLKQAENQRAISATDLKQSKLDFLPDVNASANWRRNWGTSFDAFSFQRVNRTTDFSSPQINASMPLFEGFSRIYRMHQAEHTLAADRLQAESVKNDLITQTALNFLNILVDKSQLAITRGRIEVLEQQLTRLQSLESAGQRTEAEVKNVEAQLALEEVNAVNQQNQLARDKLRLVQLLQLDPDQDYRFQAPDTMRGGRLNEPLPELSAVVSNAMSTLPQVQAPRQRMAAAADAAQAARGGLYPTVTLSGNLGSNYTSNGGVPVYEFDTLNIGGQALPIDRELVEVRRDGYFQQLEDNFSQGMNLRVSVPIFNGWQVRRQIQVAEIQHRNAELSLQQAKNELRNTVEQAYLDVEAARKRYRALQKQVRAFEEVFKVTERQYNAGTVNFLQYREALNNRSRARNELQQARYDYRFKRAILEFYNGAPLQF
jgi:outer membrane protein